MSTPSYVWVCSMNLWVLKLFLLICVFSGKRFAEAMYVVLPQGMQNFPYRDVT